MTEKILKPIIIVFAGPNGSGKSTITKLAKIISRYEKALKLIPELIKICDICHIYDNTDVPFRIFKKRKAEFFFWENEFWSKEKVRKLVGEAV